MPEVIPPARHATARLIGAVVAYVGLIGFAFLAAIIGAFLPMASDSCSSNGETSLICSSRGQGLAIALPWGGALLGLLVALLGFIPALRFRAAAIALGYVFVAAGLTAGIVIAASNG